MINYIRHDEEFYLTMKLVSGEQIIGKGFAIEEDGLTQLYVTDPIEVNMITKTTSTSIIKGVSMNKWMEFSDEDFFIFNEKDIITVGGLNDEMIHMYNLFVRKSSIDGNLDEKIKESQVNLDSDMGYVSTVDEARKKLESIFKIN